MSSEQDKKLVETINKRYKSIETWRRPFDQRNFRNLALYKGWQYYVDYESMASGTGAAPSNRMMVRLKINLVKVKVRSAMHKVTMKLPDFAVVSTNGDPVDLPTAQISESVLRYYMPRAMKPGKVQDLAAFTILMGDMFTKVHWDPDAGDDLILDDGMYKTGDLKIDLKRPHNISVEMHTTELQESPWLIDQQKRPLSYIKARWADGKKVAAEQLEDSRQLDSKFKEFMGRFRKHDSSSDDKSAIVKEMWEKPSKKFPNGRVVTMAGDVILDYKKENPYAHGLYPYAHFYALPSGGWFHETWVSDFDEIQRQLNKSLSSVIERQMSLKPKILAPMTASIGQAENIWDNEPAQVITWDNHQSDHEPKYLAPPPIAQDEFEIMRILARSADDVSGVHGISEGQQQPGMRSAAAIAHLREADNEKHAQFAAAFEDGLETTFTLALHTIKQFAGDDQVRAILSPEQKPDAVRFDSADLGTDVRIVRGSLLPQSKLVNAELMMELLKIGFFDPQNEEMVNRAKYMLDIGDFTKYHPHQKYDEANAKLENNMIAEGQPVQPSPYENFSVHMDIHVSEFKRVVYDESVPDQVKIGLRQHIDDTKMMQQQAVVPQMVHPSGQPIDSRQIEPGMPPQQAALPPGPPVEGGMPGNINQETMPPGMAPPVPPTGGV